MLSNANQEYQVYQISMKIIKERCKQICHPKIYLVYYQEMSSMLTKDIKYVTESIKEELIQQMLR